MEPNSTQPSRNGGELQSSGEFADRYLSERGLDKEWGVLIPLPPVLLPKDSRFLGGSGKASPGFILCTHDAEQRRRPELSRIRYDTPRKEDRFRSPTGVGVVIYAPLPDSFAAFEHATEKHICEGEAKTMALVGMGRAALGIGGVWNWRGPNGGLHPDLARRIKADDHVTLWIDGDWKTNPDVHRGAYLLFCALRELGAVVQLADLPNIPGLGKVGIDDLIKQWRDQGVNVEAALAALPRLENLPSPFVVDLKKPLDTAENFLAARYSHPERPVLVHWQGDFYTWEGPGWTRMSDELLREELYRFVREQGIDPKHTSINSLVDALRAAAQVNVKEVPTWLGHADAGEVLPVANGLLDMATRQLLPSTPRYFNLNWSEVEYTPGTTCPRWERFLEEVYPDDPSSRDCLQEFFGYSLTHDTSQQKAIALIGARRSGKGTIARVLQTVVGRSSCCAPTLQSMGERFGFQTWIGKKVAIVSDARTSVKNNAQAMIERVLAVTGEDTMYVDRKNREPWEGRLHVRLWLMSNMLPATSDKGGAFASRFLILNHNVSFFGREDATLERQLDAEASGVLNWALAGLERLRRRGYFVQPDSGAERVREWERINSPMLSFVQDCCEVGEGLWVTKQELRGAYRNWCIQNDINGTLDEARFTEELKAALEQRVKTAQKRMEGKRVWIFDGLAVAKHAEPKY